MSDFALRLEAYQSRLLRAGLRGAVIAPSDHMRYLCGWAEHGHERFLALAVPCAGPSTLIVPSMHVSQVEQSGVTAVDVAGWADSDGWITALLSVMNRWPAGEILAIDEELQSRHLLAIQNAGLAGGYVLAGDELFALRIAKSDSEVAAMDASGALTDAVCLETLAFLREGISETEVQEFVGAAYRARGTAPAFCIVAFGANTALPHHHTGQARLRRGDLVILDIGCLLEGYASDITRTVAFGEPRDPEAYAVYDAVREAHMEAFHAGGPGVPCGALDDIARRVLIERGYAHGILHRLGHGIGLSVHEHPYIVSGNVQILETGMCFSDEPGLYFPGRFGVRIENCVTVTRNGLRSLNAEAPHRLPVIG